MTSAYHQAIAKRRHFDRAVEIPHTTDDLRLLIKREAWSRQKTIVDVADALGMNHQRLTRVLSKHGAAGRKSVRMTPGLLDRLIDVLHISPAIARRLHTLAAIEAGWKIDPPPSRRLRRADDTIASHEPEHLGVPK